MSTLTDKQLSKIKVSSDLNSVTIGFTDTLTTHTAAEGDGGMDEEKKILNKYQAKLSHRPHKDLTDSIKKLRKFALELVDIKVDNKDIGDWTVSCVSLSGDVTLRQSRAVLTLAKECPTGKVIEFKCPQVTMYPEKEAEDRYHNAEKMSEIIEDLIEEGWSYLMGKMSEDSDGQLPLMFNIKPKLETNFVQ